MSNEPASDAWVRLAPSGHGLELGGRLNAAGTAGVWDQAMELARKLSIPAGQTAGPLSGPLSGQTPAQSSAHSSAKTPDLISGQTPAQPSGQTPVLDASAVSYLDGAGAGLLAALSQTLTRALGQGCELRGLAPEMRRFMDLYDLEELSARAPKTPARMGFIEELGRGVAATLQDLAGLVAFTGECSAAMFHALAHPGSIRMKDMWRTAELAGVNGLPIVLLIGFLMGLITAFQSAIPLQRFGMEIYVASLLTITLNRELGPLITSILLAGRSGSSFAAELGTMKINEEIAALSTMGLNPVRFLVVPRVLAAMLVTPILSVFFTLLALVGGAVVILSMGYPLGTYLDKVEAAFRMKDFLGGLFKALAFSVVVASVGCQRGLAARSGPSAVGESTTKAVVSALIFIALLDGVFAVVFYSLGL